MYVPPSFLCPSLPHPFFPYLSFAQLTTPIPSPSLHPTPRSRLAVLVALDCNDLSTCIDLPSTLAQAEVLFLSFRALVSDVDRRQALRDEGGRQFPPVGAEGLYRRKNQGGKAGEGAGNGNGVDGTETEADGLEIPNLPIIGEDLRALLG